jgi:hypothetical protein
MDLLIRNLNEKVVAVIDKKADELTKLNGYKVSRNDLLLNIIENSPGSEIMRYKEDHFDQAVKLMTTKLQKYIDSNDALIRTYLFETSDKNTTRDGEYK